MAADAQKRAFLDFLDGGDYMHRVEAMLKQGGARAGDLEHT